MIKLFAMAAFAAASCAAVPAAAVGVVVGPVNSGPQAPTGFVPGYFFADFNSGAPAQLTGGGLRTGNNDSVYAAPFGDPTQYYAVGPQAGTPATLTLSGFNKVSLYWGSMDSYNTLSFLGLGGSVIQSFTGTQLIDGAAALGAESHTVTFSLSPAEAAAVQGIRFSSTINAFEFDNIAVGTAAVAEPQTWATMMLGLGLAGGALRRRARTARALRTA